MSSNTIFSQTVESSSWQIVHNLNKIVSTDVYINIDEHLVKTMPASVEQVSLNEILVTFSTPVSGIVRVF
jgi:ribosomal protein L12E/L44/L45/RPP1/RPP2